MWMAATYFPTHGHVVKKTPKGREQIAFISTTSASVPKSDHERRHFAALDSWLSERSLCKRGYAKVSHHAGTGSADLGGPLPPLTSRTVQSVVACK
jgi:hypothetical protein